MDGMINEKNLKRELINARLDGYLSAMSQLGNGAMFNPTMTNVVPEAMVEMEYLSRGLAAAIIDRPAEDAMAHGIRLDGDEKEQVEDEFERLNFNDIMLKGVKMSLLTGCAAILPILDDAPSLTMPLNTNDIGMVRGLRLLNGLRISAGSEIDLDPMSENFGRPLYYTVNFKNSVQQYEVHWSRLIPIEGEGAGITYTDDRLFWQGRSALSACWPELRNYQNACQWALLILERKQNAVYSMKELADLLASGEDGEEIARKRVSAVDAVRNALRTTVIDGEDKFTVQDLSLSAIDDVINEFRVALSASARAPVSVIFGETPKGLGATGSGELLVYNARVQQIRSSMIFRPATRVANLIKAQRGTRWPKKTVVKFPPLWEPSEKEEAETEKLEAEAEKLATDEVLALVGVNLLTREEARRIIADRFKKFDVDPMKVPPKPREPKPTPAPGNNPQPGAN